VSAATVENGLSAWVSALTGIPVANVRWVGRKDAASFRAPNTTGPRTGTAWLSWLGGGRVVGTDEPREEDNGTAKPASDVETVLVGQRSRALQVMIDSETQDPTDDGSADAVAQTLRDRLWWPSSLAALEALNLGLVGAEELARADYPAHQRQVQRAVLGVRFNTTSHQRDTAVPSIETVAVTPTFETLTGDDVAASLEIAGEF
jgi:hypothetical protein